MGYYRRPRAAPHEVRLELEVSGEDVRAAVQAPAVEGPGIQLENMPLTMAIETAELLATHFGADIAVVGQCAMPQLSAGVVANHRRTR